MPLRVERVPTLPARPEDAIRFLYERIVEVAREFDELRNSLYTVSCVAPDKPREGMFRFADGTTWNPGKGRGLYQYVSGAWTALGEVTVTVFTDRGDPSAVDKSLGDFTKDGTWYDWDLSAIVPAGAKVVLMHVRSYGPAGSWVMFRKKGYSNVYNCVDIENFSTSIFLYTNATVGVDSNRKIQYSVSTNYTTGSLLVTVGGWWF